MLCALSFKVIVMGSNNSEENRWFLIRLNDANRETSIIDRFVMNSLFVSYLIVYSIY